MLQALLDQSGLRALLTEALGQADARLRLSHVDGALLLVRNFALSRHPLYGVPQWARRFSPARLELSASQLALLNDDRLGRTLDRLFLLDRRTLMTRFVVRVVEVFGVELARMHNDSTSITFTGVYRPRAARRDGRRRLAIVHGHNKDHRPDLKQLVWTLTIAADGGVPVHYNVDDGNVPDDRTHIATWQLLREIIGRPDFLYVPVGTYNFAVKGKKGSYPVSTANLPLAATLVIDVPYAETGQCGEAQFPGPAPSPSCTTTTSSGGATVKCR